MTSVVDLLHVACLNQGIRMIILSKTDYGWQSSVRQADGVTYRVEAHADPIIALKASLTGAPAVTVRHGRLTYEGSCSTPGPTAHDDLFGPL